MVENWRAEIESKNSDSENTKMSFSLCTASDGLVAREKLATDSFDAVVIDLKLEASDKTTVVGGDANSLIEFVLMSYPVLMAIHTGQPNKAPVKLRNYPQIRVFSKGDGAGLGDVVTWLCENELMMRTLREARKTLNQEVAQLFFKSIWPRWQQWMAPSSTTSEQVSLVNSISRHIASHAHETLLRRVEQTHPEESYFVPPINDSFETGDLFHIDDCVWILLTPRCDLASSNTASTLLFAKCDDASTRWNLSGAEKQKVTTRTQLIKHDNSQKKHFIPQVTMSDGKQRGPWLILFNDLKCQPANFGVSEKEKLLSARFASLTAAYLPSLVERFGAFYSRIGAPNHASS